MSVTNLHGGDEAHPGTRLPAPPTTLLGREREVAHVLRLLANPDIRVLTLTGPGGVGKTRLALAVAAASDGADLFVDGVAFVDLAAVREPESVPPAIARAVGVRETPGRPLLADLTERLQNLQLLVVLDTMEHLMTAGQIAAELVEAGPGITVLVTSRTALRVPGERVVPVPPLPLPDLSPKPALAELAHNPAVALFAQRAAVGDPTFALNDASAPAVAEICVLVDGLPLAIELAASRCRVLSPRGIRARLATRLPLLSGGDAERPARQRSMRATVAWSVDLLAPPEIRLLRRLSVFPGGCTADAAEAVCEGDSISVLDGLATLLDWGLLRRVDGPDGEPRFVFFETVREYGLELLAAEGEEAEARWKHAGYFLGLAEEAEAAYLTAEEGTWLVRLGAEIDNLYAALAWSVERDDPEETALRLASALWRWWDVEGSVGEGRRWLDRALSIGGDDDTAAVATALMWAGHLAGLQADTGRAIQLSERAASIARRIGHQPRLSGSLCVLGNVAFGQGNFEQATTFYEEALVVSREAGDTRGVVGLLGNLGASVLSQGDPIQATALLEEALAMAQDIGNEFGVAMALLNLAQIALTCDDHGRAATLAGEALAHVGGTSEWSGMAAECLECLATVAAARGRPEAAARLFAAAHSRRGAAGISPFEGQFRLETLRESLGPVAFAGAWAAGQALPPDQAVAEALAVASEAPPVAPTEPVSTPPATIGSLTRRELDVLRLVAAGRTDREIAATLFISPHTATTHVKHVLRKLGVDSRAAAAACAARLGLG